jgi:hypothetical protein
MSTEPTKENSTESKKGRAAAADLEERSWKLAQLVTTLVSHRFAHLRAEDGRVWADEAIVGDEIEAAFDRAEQILRRATIHDEMLVSGGEQIDIYRAFEEGETLKEPGILSRLSEIGWWRHYKDGTKEPAKNSIKDWLKGIRQKWEARLEVLKGESENNDELGAVRLVAKELERLAKLDNVIATLPNFQKHVESFVRKLSFDTPFSDLEIRVVRYHDERALFDWCLEIPPTEKGSDKPESRIYRPNKYLRYATFNKWLPREFEAKRRSDLAESFIPSSRRPLYPMSFGLFQRRWIEIPASTTAAHRSVEHKEE